MKTIVLLMVIILRAVIMVSAQEPKTDKTFQKKKFSTAVINDSSEYFANSPTFKTDTSPVRILHFQKLPGDIFTQNNQVKNDFFSNHQKSEFRMPVAGGGYNYFNMPVAVPDSTVEYYIKNKRIDYVNPLENNLKVQPLILVNGKETGQKIEDIEPENIQSVNVLKNNTAIEKYGEKGKNGVVEIMLKNENEKITTQLELRRFIAGRIKYPVAAQEIGKEGVAQLFVKFDNNGKIIIASAKASSVDFFLDEVVVTAIKADVFTQHSPQNNPDIFVDEIKRVADLLPIVDIPEFKGKTIGVTVKFQLQD